MKRDFDLIRDLLLYVEINASIDSFLEDAETFNSKYDETTVLGHIKLLSEAGLIDALDWSSMSKTTYAIKGLTMVGHDYLDSVRDPKIWSDTKSGLAKVGGTATLSIVQATAIAMLKASLAKAGINI